MAYNMLGLSKGSFVGFCCRPDPTPIGRDEVKRLFELLDTVVVECTRINVQNCTVWVSTNILQSAKRMDAFTKYLAALATDYGKRPPGPIVARLKLKGAASQDTQSNTKTQSEPSKPAPLSSARKSLHLLYVVNDIFHHAKNHGDNSAGSQNTGTNTALFNDVHRTILPHLATIVKYAGQPSGKDQRCTNRLEKLLGIWEREGYYNSDEMHELRKPLRPAETSRATVSSAQVQPPAGSVDPGIAASSAPPTVPTAAEDNDVIMIPAMHGEPGTPYYDLPAACMIPHIVPGRPIDPSLVRPLVFEERPAPPAMAQSIRDLLQYAEDLYSPNPTLANGRIGLVVDRERNVITDRVGLDSDVEWDDMGQLLKRNEETGEMEIYDTYYGWSADFCRREQARRREERNAEQEMEVDDDEDMDQDETNHFQSGSGQAGGYNGGNAFGGNAHGGSAYEGNAFGGNAHGGNTYGGNAYGGNNFGGHAPGMGMGRGTHQGMGNTRGGNFTRGGRGGPGGAWSRGGRGAPRY